LRLRLSGAMADLTSLELTPWWFGFKGRVLGGADRKTWITKGIYEFVDDDSAIIRIKELPIGCWTKDYKVFLDGILTEQEEMRNAHIEATKKAKDDKSAAPTKPVVWLRGYEEAYNDVDVDFILQMDPDYYHEARAYTADFETKFKLTTQFKTTNMVAFDPDGTIRRFGSAGEILERFYGTRLAKYSERKAHELGRLTAEITELEARLMFVRAVISGSLVIANVDDTVLFTAMKELGLPTLSDSDSTDLKGYEYLLRMRVDRLKASSVAELEKEVAAQRERKDRLLATTAETLWSTDLQDFLVAWNDYTAWRNTSYESAATDGKAVSVKKKTPRKATVAKK
jgi:DNA topoisomerase-2